MKIAYHYAPQTFLFAGTSQVHKVTGYDDYVLPQLATWLDLPEFIGSKQQLRFSVENQQWYIEDKPIEVIAYLKTDSSKTRAFTDKSVVTDDYTLVEPTTLFDEWINNVWVTNLSNKYIHDYAQVDATRSALYTQLTDPLESELARKQRQGKTDEVQMLSERINELEAKIKAENPYPDALTN
ncbi:hypothetical protein F0267_13985 [Vibrio coralliilyticus]|uniref:Uncharacterized protein n=1 Tax=Vibrio coralliilyticus TaxID=190893 RepID=A0AAN0VZ58_9VIBR|nr:hypothetical protein [Vibrio coralliilyticus]AIW21142.1 hypothetical protein IX92_19115 [Vibrio coralliilyticus]NOH39351.1 hypothetical protein [Vibrio coralliilyticus]